MENFFKTLYSSQRSEDWFNASASFFVNCNKIKRLDSEQQKPYEGVISENECLSALKQNSRFWWTRRGILFVLLVTCGKSL